MVGAFYSSSSTQMPAFPQQIAAVRAGCPDPTLLGTFTECHDVPRMAYYTNDLAILKNVNVWNILWDGIPVVYQGQEQRFRGNSDPYNREAVWLSGYSTNSTLYVLIKFLNCKSVIPPALILAFRKAMIKHDSDYVTTLSTTLFSDYETIAFLKKDVMMVLTNSGTQSSQYAVTIPLKSTSLKSSSGTEFTDIISCNKAKITSTGDFVTTISKGMPQVCSLTIFHLTERYGFRRQLCQK